MILTTAYKEYAVDAFDLAACDYLLKPFSLERFIMAVDKAIELLTLRPEPSKPTATEPFIFIKADGKIFKILHEDLLFAEAAGNHTRIVTGNQILKPSMTFTSLEEQLPKNQFLRLHRSFIVNKSRITHIEGNRVFIEQNEIPIGSNYRDDFFKQIGF